MTEVVPAKVLIEGLRDLSKQCQGIRGGEDLLRRKPRALSPVLDPQQEV